MSLSLFIARHLYRAEKKGRKVSQPAVFIAKAGIAIGLAVMIMAVCVIVGFKSEVRDKVVGFGGHLQITNAAQVQLFESIPIKVDSVWLSALEAVSGVAHVQRYTLKPGMIKTEDSFQGMVLKGVGEEYDFSFFRSHLVAGSIPLFTDSISSGQVLISQDIAVKMQLDVGDKLDTYYIEEEGVRIRRLQVAGIYRTGFSEYDNLFLLTDLYTVNRLNHFQLEQVGGVEIQLRDYNRLEEYTWEIGEWLQVEGAKLSGVKCMVRNIEQLNPALFAWLGILDMNIGVILVLMIGVAGFTMISGLFILIIERTSMIGTLKSLGADNGLIRRIFLWLAAFLIGRGIVWGNVLGLGLCLLQYYTGFLSLNPDTYYMDTVPIVFNGWYLLLLNAGTFLISVLILVGPSYLIARICPAESMRYE